LTTTVDTLTAFPCRLFAPLRHADHASQCRLLREERK
jgi:hypothetical protein